MRARAVLSVGANLGDRLGSLQGCVQAIGRLPDTDVLAISPVYETAPVGGPAQPDYLNAVLLVQTGLPPRDLLDAIHAIEASFGRVRAERFGPRTLDIDIICYAGQVSDDPELTLPHRFPGTGQPSACWPAWTGWASGQSPARCSRGRRHEADPDVHAGDRRRGLRAGRLAAAPHGL
jgi:2-amino-4-hydroxy-6-hydroxymethyldihydropteridine diphosphokinase